MGRERGIYSIQGDTIIMQIIVRGDIMVQWRFFEQRYLIINDSTLKYLSYRNLLHPDRAVNYPPEEKYSLAHFITADSIPLANPWFKKDKRVWKNKSDWEEYMVKIGKKKKR